MENLLSILNKTTGYLDRFGVENPKLNAELLLAHVLGCSRMQLYLSFERPIEGQILDELRPLMKRRAGREPIQYILGVESFMDFELKVDSRALIPRPETEELMELVFRDLRSEPKRIIDLGTGTGAIACALARKYTAAEVVASDISVETLSLTKENVEALDLGSRVQLCESNWFDKIEGTFDLLVSNPPYLADRELAEIEPEVALHEPTGALTSGKTGLEDIQTLLSKVHEHMNPGAALYMEVGAGQADAIYAIAANIDPLTCEVLSDLNGKDRFVRAFLK